MVFQRDEKLNQFSSLGFLGILTLVVTNKWMKQVTRGETSNERRNNILTVIIKLYGFIFYLNIFKNACFLLD